MNQWQWTKNDPGGFSPHFFTVTFPGEEEYKHPILLNPETNLYEIDEGIPGQPPRRCETREEVESYLNDWRTMHVPLHKRIAVGDEVKFNIQYSYCMFGRWYDLPAAYKQIEASAAEQGKVELIRDNPNNPMTKQALVQWQKTKAHRERTGFIALDRLVPADTPQSPVSYDAYLRHLSECDRLGPNMHRQ